MWYPNFDSLGLLLHAFANPIPSHPRLTHFSGHFLSKALSNMTVFFSLHTWGCSFIYVFGGSMAIILASLDFISFHQTLISFMFLHLHHSCKSRLDSFPFCTFYRVFAGHYSSNFLTVKTVRTLFNWRQFHWTIGYSFW